MEYREEPCRSALNPVKGMDFQWSLNPYMGCVHRCTFCYVRAFEHRADRPSDDRYGRSIRVKINVAEVLARELARPSGSARASRSARRPIPYQPAEGRYRLTRQCLQVLGAARNPFSIVTRGPMIVRDIDVLQAAARRAPGARELLRAHAGPRDLAADGAGHRATAPAAAGAAHAGRRRHRRRASGWRRSCPGSPTPGAARRGRPGGARGGRHRPLVQRAPPASRDARALPRESRARLAGAAAALRARCTVARTPDRRETEPIKARVAALRAEHAIADRRARRLEPPPEPEQLALLP